MTGSWEERLTNFAEGGVPWDVPTRQELDNGLESLLQVLQKVAQEPGLVGQSGNAASDAISKTASSVALEIEYVRSHLPEKLQQANDIRARARNDLGSLPSGSMSGTQESVVRGAAMGTTFLLGPISFFAGEGAVGVINNYMASQREQAAQEILRKYSDEMDSVAVARPPVFAAAFWDEEPPPPPPPSWPSDDGRGGRSGGRSFENYPDWDVSPVSPASGGGGNGDLSQPELHTLPGYAPNPPGHGSIDGDIPVIDLRNIKPEPTPDGSIHGTPTLPGVIPSAPGGGSLGGSGGAGAGIGSGLGAGLIAGGGGAAALRNIARGAGAPGGSLFSGAGGTAASGAAGRSGGLLGKTGAAGSGSGLGTRGAGGMGGAAGGGAPGSSTVKGAGMRAGGMSGGGGGAAGGGAAGGGARGAGAGGRGVGGMGGPGSRSDRKDDTARGLGGPIAPRMDDDEEIGPRSENAQAGGRDD